MRLHITRASADTAESISNRTAFRVLSESSPLTRLLRAQILTDAGSLVQPVFLLVQKDVYRYQPSELWPLTNLDVEASWQQAHAFFPLGPSGKTSAGAIDRDPIRLGESGATDGGRNAFQSLFYCGHRGVFFHPPCPGCGQALFLCKDDPLLLSQGLSAYSSSLRRYLYCPSCPPSKEGNGFYASSLDASDSVGVRDGGGLIGAWRHLLAGGLAPTGFPCLNCPERDKCHGPENLAIERIIPFGFYPFHMLVVKAMTIRAADFLPLVSGASLEAVEKRLHENNASARLPDVAELRRRVGEKDLFLFDGTEKHFLEVLYLKLSFLNEITQMVLTAPAPLDINAALDCMWVKIHAQGSFLPGLWSFNVGYMDIGLTREAAPGRPGANRAQLSYFIGLVWFHVLLSNGSLPAAAVTAELVARIEKKHAPDAGGDNDPLFAPVNIFWNPAARPSSAFPFEWKALWTKTLGLAWDLLRADRPEAGGSSDQITRELSVIRKEIKKLLFVAGPAPAITAADPSDDPAILRILAGIKEKWDITLDYAPSDATETVHIRQETAHIAASREETALPETETPRQAGKGVLETTRELETVILTREKPEEPLAETMVLNRDGGGKNPLEETVILTPEKGGEALEETIVLSRDKGASPVAEAVSVKEEKMDEDLEKTVILPGKTIPQQPPASTPIAPQGGTDEDDDLLSETIILRLPKK